MSKYTGEAIIHNILEIRYPELYKEEILFLVSLWKLVEQFGDLQTIHNLMGKGSHIEEVIALALSEDENLI